MHTVLSTQLMLAVFVAGYLAIIFEHYLKINKTAIALLTAVVCWGAYFVYDNQTVDTSMSELGHHLSDVAQIILFLLGAMTLVELIDVHKGFSVITQVVKTRSKRKMLLIVGLVSFFLSAILDNLTTTILMVSLLKKIIPERKERITLACLIVIAANAGGAWTPIGDVTTTMLWIDGKITTVEIMKKLFLPSVSCLAVPLVWFMISAKGSYSKEMVSLKEKEEPHARLILCLGLLSMVFVPIIKHFTNLPPFMAILAGLGFLWFVTDIIHKDVEDRSHLKIPFVLAKIDISSILFFFGILLAVDALQAVALLDKLAQVLDRTFSSYTTVGTLIGLLSAVVDNVPLVAGSMWMYDVTQFPVNHPFWLLLAYAAGTGGSLLIIGSAAGVAVMGLEKMDFFTYLKKACLPAALGYFLGIIIFVFVIF